MKGALIVVGLAALSLAGCAKHSESCKKSVDLVAPFSDLGLPTGDGNGRVCEGDNKKIKVEHTGNDTAGWTEKYGAAITGKGYTKKDCSKSQCVYVKDKARLRVNVLDLKKWTTVIVEDYPEK